MNCVTVQFPQNRNKKVKIKKDFSPAFDSWRPGTAPALPSSSPGPPWTWSSSWTCPWGRTRRCTSSGFSWSPWSASATSGSGVGASRGTGRTSRWGISSGSFPGTTRASRRCRPCGPTRRRRSWCTCLQKKIKVRLREICLIYLSHLFKKIWKQ